MKKNPTYDLVAVLFIISISIFALNRATHEYRWSAWAIGDAQNLNAALHFKNEGFLRHYFLTYYHPGYLGKSIGSETEIGYYTHYPPLSAILNGVIACLSGNKLFIFRAVAIFFSALALFFWYFIACQFFDKRIALLSTIFIGSSVAFLEFIDGLSGYTYDEFYSYGAILLFLIAENNERVKKKENTIINSCNDGSMGLCISTVI